MYSLKDWVETGFSFEDFIALKGFQKEPSDELRQYLEGKTGKSYEETTMGEINGVFPGIYDGYFLAQVPAILKIYQDLKEQGFG